MNDKQKKIIVAIISSIVIVMMLIMIFVIFFIYYPFSGEPGYSDTVIYRYGGEKTPQLITNNVGYYNRERNSIDRVNTDTHCKYIVANLSGKDLTLMAFGFRQDTGLVSNYEFAKVKPSETLEYKNGLMLDEKLVPVFVDQAIEISYYNNSGVKVNAMSGKNLNLPFEKTLLTISDKDDDSISIIPSKY